MPSVVAAVAEELFQNSVDAAREESAGGRIRGTAEGEIQNLSRGPHFGGGVRIGEHSRD